MQDTVAQMSNYKRKMQMERDYKEDLEKEVIKQ